LVAIYDRALTAIEIQQNFAAGPNGANVHLPPPTNQAPVVEAGGAQTITLPASVVLSGQVTDDALPNPPGTVTTTWTQLDGPGIATFEDATAVQTTVSFSVVGTYVLRLTGNDGALEASAAVTITVTAASTPPTVVSFTATPAIITVGEAATLSWTTTNVTSVSLTPTGGDGLAPNAALLVQPATTTTYTLTASGPGGTTSVPVTITVTAVDESAPRVTAGLVVYYPFTADSGTEATDQAGTGAPMDLTLSGNVTWATATNGVVLAGGTVGTLEPATKLLEALQTTHHSSVELWVTPATLAQGGPARLLEVGQDASRQNFMMGQAGNELEILLLHTDKSAEGKPTLKAKDTLSTGLMHVVHIYDGVRERLYINAVEQPNSVGRQGDYSNWDSTARLTLGNTPTSDRPWRGTVRLVAIYDRALTAIEIQQNFAAGPNGAKIAAVSPHHGGLWSLTIGTT
jgi:hypothetical protein